MRVPSRENAGETAGSLPDVICRIPAPLVVTRNSCWTPAPSGSAEKMIQRGAGAPCVATAATHAAMTADARRSDHRLDVIAQISSTRHCYFGIVWAPRLLAVGAALVLAATADLLTTDRARAHASSAVASSFPSPPPNATVYSRQLGNDALALAVVPQRDGAVLLQASVIGRQGNGVRGLHVTFTVAGQRQTASACAPGCYRTRFSPSGPPRAVDVDIAGRTKPPWHVGLPTEWPPRDASTLVSRAARTWRSLHSLSFRETLGSGVGTALVSTWRVQAPDRIAYQVQGGWAGVVIGTRRWDRAPGARWEVSPQTPVHQPVPFWVSVTNAHVLGNVTLGGRQAVRVSFFDPGSHAWFTLVVARKTFRTLESHMVTNAHFMHDVYSAFDSTPAIVPPR
jgi:hypothetical protein